MVALQIRDVPTPLRDALAAAARERSESLQEYLLHLLEREAAALENRRLLRDWTDKPLGSAESSDLATYVRDERERREQHLASLVAGDDK
jgi:hypothetical protein